ncbi:hypothetical protein AGMMS50276_33120 [Synergistales bacterium]|nr:hypothetical protein AGMMS50276_33120 [Synergistales bacterium]
MPTPPVAERGITTERAQTQQGIFTDNLIPERVFTSELRRIDSTLSGIIKTLERIDGRLDKVDAKIDKVESGLNAKIDSVRAELRADIKDVRDDNKATNARIDKVESLLLGILTTVIISIIAQVVLRYI